MEWQEGNIRYLGINICKTNDRMVENINPMILYIVNRCQTWVIYKLPLFGRIAADKITLMPKLVCILFLNSNLEIPNKVLNKIEAVLNRFIFGTIKKLGLSKRL